MRKAAFLTLSKVMRFCIELVPDGIASVVIEELMVVDTAADDIDDVSGGVVTVVDVPDDVGSLVGGNVVDGGVITVVDVPAEVKSLEGGDVDSTVVDVPGDVGSLVGGNVVDGGVIVVVIGLTHCPFSGTIPILEHSKHDPNTFTRPPKHSSTQPLLSATCP